MTRTKLVVVAAMMSAAGLAPALAEGPFSEPAAFQSMHPDRDVLNGGQLTPWGRAMRGEQHGGANAAFASQNYMSATAPVVQSRRRSRR
jgi:hypothetical protein